MNENEIANQFEAILIKYKIITKKIQEEGIQKIKFYAQLPFFHILLSAETIELADTMRFLLHKVENKDFNTVEKLLNRIEHLIEIETSPIW